MHVLQHDDSNNELLVDGIDDNDFQLDDVHDHDSDDASDNDEHFVDNHFNDNQLNDNHNNYDEHLVINVLNDNQSTMVEDMMARCQAFAASLQVARASRLEPDLTGRQPD